MSIDHKCSYCGKNFQFSMIGGIHLLAQHEELCKENIKEKNIQKCFYDSIIQERKKVIKRK